MSCSQILNEKDNYSKVCYSVNNTYKIKMVFTDCNKNIDPTLIEVKVIKPDLNEDVINDIIKVETGFYYINYTFSEEGKFIVEWKSTIKNKVNLQKININVKDEVLAKNLKFGLDFNEIIVIDVLKGITSLDGKSSLLQNNTFSFSTEYKPFYCSVEMLRMEMGSWVDLVPDDTLALAIHWSSLEANSITSSGRINESYYYARTRFVMYDAAIKLFSMPMSTSGTGKSKQLGDLLIEDGNSVDYNLKDLISELKEERDEWWRVVNARGCIVLGQGLGPTLATKGKSNGFKKSREWHDPWEEHYIQPTQNSQYRRQGQGKYRHGFTGWNEHYYTSMKNGIGRRK